MCLRSHCVGSLSDAQECDTFSRVWIGFFLTSQCHCSFGEYWGSCTLIGALEGPLWGVGCHHPAAQRSLFSVKSGCFCFSAPGELSTQLNLLPPAGARIPFSPEKRAPAAFWLLTWLCGKLAPSSVIPLACKHSRSGSCYLFCKHNFHLFKEL